MNLNKAEVARHQLGTALDLFLRDQDPISVHVLACSGGEIADHLSKITTQQPFSSHMLKSNPEKSEGELKKLRNQYWNAFKHATTQKGQSREDDELLADFSDTINDHMLFIGWYDYMMAVNKMPVPAQVFQFAYFAMYPTKINSEKVIADAIELFGELDKVDRLEAKRRLKMVVDDHLQNTEIMSDPGTDQRPLTLSNVSA